MEPYQELEVEFGFWAGRSHTVACATGTAALHLALECLRLPPGSEIIVPEFTMIACARAVTLSGLVPRFADCGDDLLVNVDTVSRAWESSGISNSVVALMPVHVYGRRVSADVFDWARARGLAIIEDCAEFHGGKTDPLADASTWSFYRNKIVAGEEGGMCAFRAKEHVERARQLRSLGFTKEHDFRHVPRGHNYRLSNAHAELILQSLREARQINIPKRRLIEHWYNERVPKQYKMPPRDCCWVYDLRIPGMRWERPHNLSFSQDNLVHELNLSGIPARHGFKPMSVQEEYLPLRSTDDPRILNAYRLSQEVIYLPIHPAMTEQNVDRYVNRLLEIAPPS